MDDLYLYELLKTLNMPVSYDHFDEDVQPPFILYRNTDSTSKYADDKTYSIFNNFIVDLITVKKDNLVESQLETLFNDNDIPYSKTIDFLDSEGVYQVRYFIS